eukprot:scaffold19390_cov23-Tisochrysis_lutea.AAC.1
MASVPQCLLGEQGTGEPVTGSRGVAAELKAAKKEAESKRDVLCEALFRKAAALLRIEEELDYPGGAAPWNPSAVASSSSNTSTRGTAAERNFLTSELCVASRYNENPAYTPAVSVLFEEPRCMVPL